MARLRRLPFADVGDALVDHHRALRQGMPEAVFGPGKTPEQCARIVTELLANGDGPGARHPGVGGAGQGDRGGRRPGRELAQPPAACSTARPRRRSTPSVVVVTAGTADAPVADECELTLRAYGFAPRGSTTSAWPGCIACSPISTTCIDADAVVVVAGMEGALASVVGGLTAAPVVAVPTSVGYGSSLEASRRCWRCSRRAPAASRSSASTTASARRAPWRGCCEPDVTATVASPTSQCSAGVAGDMLLGALVDAGADRQRGRSTALAGLGVDGYALTFERVQRCGVAATWANVVVDDHEHAPRAPPRRPGDPQAARRCRPARPRPQPRPGGLRRRSPRPRARSTASIPTTSSSTRSAPSTPIVDVVGIAAALESLAIDEIVAGPVATGRGTITAAHGDLPNPAPAVARLLAAAAMPPIGIDTDLELATPTGVAALAALAASFGPMPAMTVTAVGYGAGRADTAGRPNVVQVIVGEAPRPDAVAPPPGRAAVQVDVNVDDVTGEVLAHTIARRSSPPARSTPGRRRS